MDKKCVILYAEDFTADVWEQYCIICNKSPMATSLKIIFNEGDVEEEYDDLIIDFGDEEFPEEDEDELVHYRCTNCDFCFDEHEITSIDDDENGLCPACGKPLDDYDIDYIG